MSLCCRRTSSWSPAGGARCWRCGRRLLVCGVVFASMQFMVSNFIGPQLTDILGSIWRDGCAGASAALLEAGRSRSDGSR